ncbi:hypothetical protein ACFORG_07335 [Lutimaribacter marinistellae]|uniref:Sulfotransferase domain-containing protein n=1 Tax=Lutimaribacter marinistellae TaxID=1820329 RepID=A0ABV7TFS2_9RHOB
MQLVFHTGAHATDEDRLLKTLLRNADDLSALGAAIPRPVRYRGLMKKTFAALEEGEPNPDGRDVLLDAFIGDQSVDRVILSHFDFFGTSWSAIRDGMFYPLAAPRMAQLASIFAFDEVEMFMAIRNPASFVPVILSRLSTEHRDQILRTTDIGALRWSDLIHRIREEAPQVRLTIWCNEDTPLIWGEVVRELAGLDHGEKIKGGFALLAEIMSQEGMSRFRTYLHEHPELTEMQKRRVISAFLDKYAIDEALEEELDLPGWTEDHIEALTEIYDDDVLEIQRIPGVSFIAP